MAHPAHEQDLEQERLAEASLGAGGGFGARVPALAGAPVRGEFGRPQQFGLPAPIANAAAGRFPTPPPPFAGQGTTGGTRISRAQARGDTAFLRRQAGAGSRLALGAVTGLAPSELSRRGRAQGSIVGDIEREAVDQRDRQAGIQREGLKAAGVAGAAGLEAAGGVEEAIEGRRGVEAQAAAAVKASEDVLAGRQIISDADKEIAKTVAGGTEAVATLELIGASIKAQADAGEDGDASIIDIFDSVSAGMKGLLRAQSEADPADLPKIQAQIDKLTPIIDAIAGSFGEQVGAVVPDDAGADTDNAARIDRVRAAIDTDGTPGVSSNEINTKKEEIRAIILGGVDPGTGERLSETQRKTLRDTLTDLRFIEKDL